jgi:hypothetical protein
MFFFQLLVSRNRVVANLAVYLLLSGFSGLFSPVQAQSVTVNVPEILFLRTAPQASGCAGQPITSVANFWSNAPQNLTVTTTVWSAPDCSGSVVSTNSFTVVPLGLITPITLNLNDALNPGTYGFQVHVASPTLSTSGCVPVLITGISSVSIAGNATPACLGDSRSLTAVVAGNNPGALSFQWHRAGQLLNVPTSTSVLSLPAVSLADAGSYSVAVSSSCNALTSGAFSLTVNGHNAQLTLLNGGRTVQATGGSSYQLVQPMDSINGYQIRETASSRDGFFTLKRPGPFWVVVTGANGCSTRVDGVSQ